MAEQPEPEFLGPLENHTVTQGRDVYFTCVVNHLSSYKVKNLRIRRLLLTQTHLSFHLRRKKEQPYTTPVNILLVIGTDTDDALAHTLNI